MRFVGYLVGWLLLNGVGVWAQAPPEREAGETIRFIRLAETKRQLDLGEEKLLRLNEILDAYEHKRFGLIRKEQNLRREAQNPDLPPDKGFALLEDYLAVQDEMHQNERQLWKTIKAEFPPDEAFKIWMFYEKFQKEMLKRLKTIHDRRKMIRENRRSW